MDGCQFVVGPEAEPRVGRHLDGFDEPRGEELFEIGVFGKLPAQLDPQGRPVLLREDVLADQATIHQVTQVLQRRGVVHRSAGRSGGSRTEHRAGVIVFVHQQRREAVNLDRAAEQFFVQASKDLAQPAKHGMHREDGLVHARQRQGGCRGRTIARGDAEPQRRLVAGAVDVAILRNVDDQLIGWLDDDQHVAPQPFALAIQAVGVQPQRSAQLGRQVQRELRPAVFEGDHAGEHCPLALHDVHVHVAAAGGADVQPGRLTGGVGGLVRAENHPLARGGAQAVFLSAAAACLVDGDEGQPFGHVVDACHRHAGVVGLQRFDELLDAQPRFRRSAVGVAGHQEHAVLQALGEHAILHDHGDADVLRGDLHVARAGVLLPGGVPHAGGEGQLGVAGGAFVGHQRIGQLQLEPRLAVGVGLERELLEDVLAGQGIIGQVQLDLATGDGLAEMVAGPDGSGDDLAGQVVGFVGADSHVERGQLVVEHLDGLLADDAGDVRLDAIPPGGDLGVQGQVGRGDAILAERQFVPRDQVAGRVGHGEGRRRTAARFVRGVGQRHQPHVDRLAGLIDRFVGGEEHLGPARDADGRLDAGQVGVRRAGHQRVGVRGPIGHVHGPGGYALAVGGPSCQGVDLPGRTFQGQFDRYVRLAVAFVVAHGGDQAGGSAAELFILPQHAEHALRRDGVMVVVRRDGKHHQRRSRQRSREARELQQSTPGHLPALALGGEHVPSRGEGTVLGGVGGLAEIAGEHALPRDGLLVGQLPFGIVFDLLANAGFGLGVQQVEEEPIHQVIKLSGLIGFHGAPPARGL